MDSEKKEGKDIYKDYRDYISNLSDIEREIRNEFVKFKNKINDDTPTLDLENNIKNLLKKYKGIKDGLEEAYNDRNAPPGYPLKELDKRQKEIQQFKITYEKMEKELSSNVDEKYKFKGQIDEDYSQKEEFKYMTSGELQSLEKQKLNNQDKQLEGITLDVKKNVVLATNAKHVIKEQNKKLEQINEDIERTNTKMNKVTERFKNYASACSWCKLIIFLIIEILIACGLFLFLFLD